MSLTVKFWGVRGSLPSSLTPQGWTTHFESLMQDFFKQGHKNLNDIQNYIKSKASAEIGGYGTATTCIEVISKSDRIIIDGGSGLRRLSDEIMQNQSLKKNPKIHIFLTHFHWDHLIGLPFFAPHFMKDIEINYYAVQPELENLIRGKFRKPYFPVAFESLPAKINFNILKPRVSVQISDMKITPYQLDHPDECWGYKVESGGKVYAHCVDTEGTRNTRQELGADLPLYQNIDLMYYDAQYTLPELAEKANWGHSAAQLGLEIAFRENIKKVIFAHHDPGANIQHIQELEEQTREFYQLKIKSAESNHIVVDWQFAQEGLSIQI